MSVENVHTDYREVDSTVKFRLSNSNELCLLFPSDGDCYLLPEAAGPIRSLADFREAFPIKVASVPPLGPLENHEPIIRMETVRSSLQTHRASRHFRNYWHHFPDDFLEFSSMITATWPGLVVEPPEVYYDSGKPMLRMFCQENRVTREIFWSGVGFQVWCQLLTHLTRQGETTLIVVDEPEVYLHPEVQRQLLGLLRDKNADLLLATHSTEIVSEADPSEILLMDKSRRSARRVKDIEGVQLALESIGSIQNVTLTQLARSRRVIFSESTDDFRIVRRFAGILGFPEVAAGVSLTNVESDGFSHWSRIRDFAWGLSKTVDSKLGIGAVFDRDFWPQEKIDKVVADLTNHVDFVWVHGRKEIENYLLIPSVLRKAIERAVADRQRRTGAEPGGEIPDVNSLLEELSAPMRVGHQSQYVARRWESLRTSGRDHAEVSGETIEWFEDKWQMLPTRLEVVGGKELLKRLRAVLSETLGIGLTTNQILSAFAKSEIPKDIVDLVEKLEAFRQRGNT